MGGGDKAAVNITQPKVQQLTQLSSPPLLAGSGLVLPSWWQMMASWSPERSVATVQAEA